MARSFRRFRPGRVAGIAALLAAACASGAGLSRAASPDDKVFVIGNYPVEARAANAVAAKEKAIADGQQAAFHSLLKRLVPVTAYGRLGELRDTRAGDLIAGFSVRSERNSTTEYIASYDFTFQAEAVRNILEAEGIPFLDRQAEPLTLIPVYRAPAAAGSASGALADARGSDTWLYAWKALDLGNALTPVALTPVRRETLPETLQAVLAGDSRALRALGTEYRAGSIVVALLEPQAGGDRIRVTMAGRDEAGAFGLVRNYRMDGDLAYSAEAAAVVSLGILEGRWKAVAARPERSGGYPAAGGAAAAALRIAVEFGNMTQWQVISRQLAQTPDVSDLEVEGLSARGARVSLRYPGGLERLAAAVAEYGLRLRPTPSGAWVLSPR